jgi:lipopolysaccharide export system permease protein
VQACPVTGWEKWGVSRFDRYLLSQLITLFGFFSLVLVAVYWVNRAVKLFDTLVGNGESAMVFLEFTALTLPNVIRLVLPISAFAAAVYATNRLTRDSELVVMQATGFSPFRLARPVLIFGVIVALMMAALLHVIVPASRQALALRGAEIEANVSARFLRDGAFMHPAPGVTLYIREVAPEGELRDVFVSDAREPDRRTTYSARRALAVQTDTGPKVVMYDGMVQTLTYADRRLAVTRFVDLTYDLGFATGGASRGRVSIEELPTRDLLAATPERMAETGASRAAMIFEGHSRLARPLLAVAGPLIGFATLLVGAFSRFGLWRQVLAAVVLIIVLQMTDNLAATVAMRDERAWALTYVAPTLGYLIAAGLLWWAGRPRRPPRAGPLPEATA